MITGHNEKLMTPKSLPFDQARSGRLTLRSILTKYDALSMSAHADVEVSKHITELTLRGLRASTIYNRRKCLGRLQAWAGGRPLLSLTDGDLRRWQEQRARELSPGARRGELSHARELYRWAVREGLLEADPTARLPMPRAPRRLPRPMPESAFHEALSCATPRCAAALALGGYAGLRAMEIAQLDWSEVDLNGNPPSLRVVNGKGGVGRVVFIGAQLARYLVGLPDRRGPVIRRGDGARGFNPPHAISHLVNRHLHRNGIPETLHQLRHRFATVAYQADRDIRAVQELLGHASPTTTSIYAAPGADARWRAVVAASAA